MAESPAPSAVDVVYINLDASHDRRAGMEAHLGGLALPWPVRRQSALRGDGSAAQITQSELGCLRSHEAVLRAARPGRYTLVLEDDARLSGLVGKALPDILARVGDAVDVVFLSCTIEYTNIWLVRGLLQLRRKLRAVGDNRLRLLDAQRCYAFGCVAYVLHPRARHRLGAAFAAARTSGYRETVDRMYQRLIRSGELSAQVVFPYLAQVEMDYASTLGDRTGQLDAGRYAAIHNLFALEADSGGLLRWVLENAARDGFEADAFIASQLILQKYMQR
jgi:GR25 family glycosyltransferase involved in LPS biosynthesis